MAGTTGSGWRIRWKKGIAYVRFSYVGRRYEISTGTRDPKQAPEIAARIYADTISGRVKVAKQTAPVTTPVDELAAEWLADIENDLGEGVFDLYMNYSNRWHEFFETIGQINTASAATFTRERLKSVQRTTVQKELGALRRFLKWCAELGHIAEAPTINPIDRNAKGTQYAKRRRVAAPHEGYRDADVLKFLALLPERAERGDFVVRARFEFQYHTGLRSSLLDRLETRDVAEDFSKIHIRKEIDKSNFDRDVPLTVEAQDALKRAMPNEPGLIWGKRDYRHLTVPAAKKAFGEELGAEFTPQHFRSVRASAWLSSGVPLSAVAHLVGHRRLTTTDIYARSSFDTVKHALDRSNWGAVGGFGGAERSDFETELSNYPNLLCEGEDSNLHGSYPTSTSSSGNSQKTGDLAIQPPQKSEGFRNPEKPIGGAPQPDAVELALSEALARASAAGQWETVQALARELEARRKARNAREVVDLDAERAKRGR